MKTVGPRRSAVAISRATLRTRPDRIACEPPPSDEFEGMKVQVWRCRYGVDVVQVSDGKVFVCIKLKSSYILSYYLQSPFAVCGTTSPDRSHCLLRVCLLELLVARSLLSSSSY